MTSSVLKTDDQPAAAQSLKICLLGYRSNPFSGGQGIYIRYMARALTRQGHQVDVISGPPYPDLDEGARLIKLPSLDLYSEPDHIKALRPKHLLSFTDFFEWFSMLTGGFPEPYTFGRRLEKYFREHRPDYDIIHDNQSLCYGLLSLEKAGFPVVTTIHHPITSDLQIALASEDDWGMRLLIRRWHNFLGMQKKVVSKLKNIVSVSSRSRTDIAAAFNIPESRITVINNGIDTGVFCPKPGIKREPCTIMATASADAPLKGLIYLIRAIAQLKPEFPAIQLLVVGKLKEDGDTSKLIDELGMAQTISFVSGISTEELVERYARATLVVVPSVYEGFGLPAGEAMACGVPVVSTRGGALPEVVGDAGVLVPVRDSESLAAAIMELLTTPEIRERLGRQGRARILKLFSWDVAAQQLINYYQELLPASVKRPSAEET